jgi:hypothetical protein
VRARAAAVALVATASLPGVLTGCSATDDAGTTDPAATDPAQAAGVAWNPCDGLRAATVGRYAGQRMVEQTGTSDQPRCAFTPAATGGPAFDVSYLWFDGGLDAAWDTMGKVRGTVTDIRVPGADAARLVVHAQRPAVLVTGFVQVGGLVQSVNAVQLRPYDRRTVVSTTRELLADLVERAPDAPA